MKTLTRWQIERFPGYSFAAYWAIAWLRVKRAKATEGLANRLATIIAMVLAGQLLLSRSLATGPLRQRFLPTEQWIGWSGVALTALGVGTAIWARDCLGQYWSARVTLKQGHRLIRSSPYAYLQHPIHTGRLVAASGTAVVVGERRGVLAAIVVLATHCRKAAREEELLETEFGK